MRQTKGQSLVSFLIGLPFALLAIGGVLGALMALGARALLDLETYALARAHLYGNQLDRCRPSRYWGQLSPTTRLKVHQACPEPGRAEGTLHWDDEVLFRARVDLREGSFGR